MLVMPCKCFGVTVSVIVPCYYKHFKNIPELLDNLSCQSQLPDEVVISLSEANKVEKSAINAVKKINYPFKLRILTTKKNKRAGENRNIAAHYSKGDILITQDADDLPHPQRIEIIAYIMEKTKSDHVIHQWVSENYDLMKENSGRPIWQNKYENFENIQLEKISSVVQFPSLKWGTCGNIGITRKVFKMVKWTSHKGGEDVLFSKKIIEKFRNSVFAEIPLLIYRQRFSSSKS